MFNNNNIYKLIKRAKDEKCISKDPLKRIIPNPIKFVYSFTLNSKNEPYSEEKIKFQENDNINLKYTQKKEESKNINFNNTIKEKRKKDMIFQNKNDKQNILEKDYKSLEGKKTKIKQKTTDINNISIYNQQLYLNKNINLNSTQSIKSDNKKEKNFINKKRIPEYNGKNENNKKKCSNVVKNNIIHQIYNSKNINLWEDDSESNENNDDKHKEKNNEYFLPIHKQIEFIHKCQNGFKKYVVEKKSDYDKDLDKGRVKKTHKNKIGFKKHKNYFQKISNKNIKRQNKSYN